MPMRPEPEIQAAHDRWKAILAGDVSSPLSEADTLNAIAQLDVLCWVLRDDHINTFASNLEKVDAFLLSRMFPKEGE